MTYLEKLFAMVKFDGTKSLSSPVSCADCGRFIAYADLEAGLCKFTFQPDSEFGPEVAEWSCKVCSRHV